MKKLIIPAMALAMASQPVEGQTLYEAVYENVQKVLNLPAASAAEKQENQFKLEALNYLKTKGQQEGLTRDSYFLDSQAVNLTSFIDDFLTNVRTAEKTSKAKGEEMVRCYINAAKKFPLFQDPANTVADESKLIPFPLNTDWEKAYDNATTVAKSIIKRK